VQWNHEVEVVDLVGFCTDVMREGEAQLKELVAS